MKLRIHHFFDIIRDFGSGNEIHPHPYGHSYHKVAKTILQNPETEVEIVIGADQICEGCIHLTGTSCDDKITHRKDFTSKEKFNDYLDSRIIDICGIDISKKYTLKSLLQFSDKYLKNIESIYEGNDFEHTLRRKENVLMGLNFYKCRCGLM